MFLTTIFSWMLVDVICIRRIDVVAQKYAVFREIHDGMGGVQQKLSMEMNRNMAKKLAQLSTQQLTMDSGKG